VTIPDFFVKSVNNRHNTFSEFSFQRSDQIWWFWGIIQPQV